MAVQESEGPKDALWGTCLHVPSLDEKHESFDCNIGITMPIHVDREKWPRDQEDAAKYAARAANATTKHLRDYVHADGFTCRMYTRRMHAYLSRRRNGRKVHWTGAEVIPCKNYRGTLPSFKFMGGRLLVGDFHSWSMEYVDP